MKLKNGFSLIEVLVTLLVIGVVASLTIPGLRRNADDRTVATNLKKIHSDLNQATKLAMSNDSVGLFYRINAVRQKSEQAFEDEFVKKYFNVAVVCPAGDAADCFGESSFIEQNGNANKSYLLTNGVSLMFKNEYPLKSTKLFNYVFVDVNGPKKPNKAGTDQFMLTLNSHSGEVFAGKSGNNGLKDDFKKNCENGDDYEMSWACAAQIQKDGWEIKY